MTTPGRRDAYRFHNNDAEERAVLRASNTHENRVLMEFSPFKTSRAPRPAWDDRSAISTNNIGLQTIAKHSII